MRQENANRLGVFFARRYQRPYLSFLSIKAADIRSYLHEKGLALRSGGEEDYFEAIACSHVADFVPPALQFEQNNCLKRAPIIRASRPLVDGNKPGIHGICFARVYRPPAL